ncbi:MAG: type II secretion system protein [Candidatus Hinthialibacter antarcticus]|nr:type II secretion system protein [Candidatus Hinthialibacter antarcticus]
MNRLHKRWLEVVVVIGVFCIILSITLPAFFRNQQAESNAMIFDGMAQILNAVQQYQNEHQQYPAAVSEGKQQIVWDQDGMLLFNNLNYDYLHSFLLCAKPDGLKMPKEFVDLQYSQNFSLDAISLFRNSTNKSLVIAIVANQFNQPPLKQMLIHLDSVVPGQPIIQPHYFFAPSNGLTSRGSMYLDIYGNHSPWVHPPKTELLPCSISDIIVEGVVDE